VGTRLPARTVARIVVLVSATVVPLFIPVVASADSDSLAAQLHRLRACESSNNYHANTGNGYYGAYQFNPSTWRAMGYGGRADRAAPRTQDDATTKLHARRGWKPWPTCARKEHLH
jgi:hypothetical protein